MVRDVENHVAAGETRSFIQTEIDLSLFNRLVCGGAQLGSVVTIGSILSAPSREYTLKNDSGLQSLIENGFFKAAECLIKCGWEFEKEKWFDKFDLASTDLSKIYIHGERYRIIGKENAKSELQTLIQSTKSELKALVQRCRDVIRRQLVKASSGSEIESKIDVLPVPTMIKSYLKFVDCCHKTETIQLIKISS